MEIEQLKRFVVMAQCLNFSKAAEMLFITQPTLSHAISKMEEQLGAPLFNRTTKNVSLTRAGEILLPTAISIIESYEKTLSDIDDELHTQSNILNIGFTGAGMDGGFNLWLRLFRQNHPEVKVQLQRYLPEEMKGALQEKLVDLCFVYEMYLLALPGVKTKKVLHERFELALPSDHPLAKEKEVPLSMLKDEPMLFREQSLAPMYYDRVMKICKARNYVPNVSPVKASFGMMHRMISEGIGVAILSHAAYKTSTYEPVNVGFVQIDDGTDLDNFVYSVWSGHLSKNAKEFMKIVEENPLPDE